MSPGPIEDTIAALRQQPMVLALVLMNLLLVGLLYYGSVVAANERRAELELLYNNRSEVAKLLASCYPAPPR